MLFTSKAFLVLLTITLFIYYNNLFKNVQIWTLIISSIIFYSYNEPLHVIILLFSILINAFASYFIVYGNKNFKYVYAFSGVFLNLILLIYFKYVTLFAHTFLNPNTSTFDFLSKIPLPIGISFFTFQGISLIIDIYKGEKISGNEVVSKSFITHFKNVFFFKSFFPQLISGPIVKAYDFFPQIAYKSYRDLDYNKIFQLLILGYFFKCVVADNLKDFTQWISYPYFLGKPTITLASLLFAYSFQIFADFAGYSLIAIGLAKLFGYNFNINFNFPYISQSFKEFWKRWHISLSTFLMEYLYFPLGGNKKGKIRMYFNLLIVMLLGGLWHGAAWSYLFWGAFHGIALVIERVFNDYFNFKENANKLFIFFKVIFIFIFI